MKKNWAFLVHYRNGRDKKCLIEAFGVIPDKITVLSRASDGGFFILIPQSPEELLEKPKEAQKTITEATSFAQELGVSVIGLGELTSPLTGGGKYLLNRVSSDVIITSGNSLTAGVVFSDVLKISEKTDKKNPVIGIVGATGSVGCAVTKFFDDHKKNLFLFARNETKLSLLARESRAEYSSDLKDLKKTDIVVVLISGTGNIIEPHHLKEDAIIYDITQPRNVNPSIKETMKGITLIEGGYVKNPGIELGFDFNLPNGNVFACWAETKLLTQTEEHFCSEDLTGKASHIIASQLYEEAKKYGYIRG